MNDKQREFLAKRVQSTFDDQVEELRKQLTQQPSLNNYLVAAFLDNTIQFTNMDALKEKMRAKVLKFGASDALVREEDEDSYFSARNRNRGDRKQNTVTVKAEDLFVIPQNYLDELAIYNKHKSEIDEKIKQLEATKNTVIMKVQIGSSAVLDKLVMQIDSIGDIDLMNNQLILGEGNKEK